MMKLFIAFVMTAMIGVLVVQSAFAQTNTSTPSPTGTATVTPTVSPAVKAETTQAPEGAPKTGYGTLNVR
jgi:hypothetical protein